MSVGNMISKPLYFVDCSTLSATLESVPMVVSIGVSGDCQWPTSSASVPSWNGIKKVIDFWRNTKLSIAFMVLIISSHPYGHSGLVVSRFHFLLVPNQDPEWPQKAENLTLPGSAPECRTRNRDKLSSTQAEPVQANKSGVADFPSISCTTSWRRSRYTAT